MKPGAASCIVRFVEPQDVGAVLSSWLRSYADDRPRGLAASLYYAEQQALAKAIMARKDAVTLCAVDPESSWHLFGWLCGEHRGEQPVVHYAYTFEKFRRQGIFEALLGRFLDGSTVRPLYTHRTHTGKTLAEKFGGTFNPYKAQDTQ